MVDVGAIRFKTELDLGSLDGQIRALQSRLSGKNLKVDIGAGTAAKNFEQVNGQIGQVSKSLRGVTRDQGQFNAATGALAGVAGAGAFIALDAAIQTVKSSVAALVGVFTEASSEFRKLEANLLSFQAKTQGVTVDMASLKDEITAVAKTTSQTPATLSETATTLVSLGVAGEEVEGRLSALAQAADVLGENPVILGRTFQGALASYAQFGVGVEEVSDTVLQAVNTTAVGSRQGVQEFEQLFSRAAAPAANLGVTLQELTTAFAVFREAGASPFAAASALETGLNRIASRRDQLEKEGVELQFKENGGLDLEKTLISLQRRLEGLAPTEQSSLLSKLFGESVGSDILSLINKIEGSYSKARENIDGFNGATARSFDIVSQGTDFQAGITEGLLATAVTALGETINPIEKGFIALQQAILNAVSVDLTPLSDAATRLGAVLSGNPELVDNLSAAISDLVADGVGGLVRIIDGITVLVDNDEAIAQVSEGIRSIGEALQAVGTGVSFAFTLADSIASINAVLLDTPILGDALRGALENPLNPFGGLLSGALEGINNVLTGLRDTAADVFGPAFTTVLEGVAGVARDVRDALAEIPNIGAPIDAFLDRIAERIEKLAQRLDNLLSRLPGAEADRVAPTPTVETTGISAALDGLSAFQTAITDASQTTEDNPLGPTFKTPEEGLGAAGQLKEFKRNQEILLNGIEESSKEAQTRLAALDLPEDVNAQRAAQIERTALQDRLAGREKFLADLKVLANRPGITVEDSTKIESEIAATEKTIADERLAIAQNLRSERVRTREEELRLFEEEKAIAESRLQLTQQGQTNEVLGQQASGQIDAEQAADRIADIQQSSTRQTIALKEEEIAEVRRLEASKVLEAEDAAARIRGLQVDLAQLNGQLIQGEIEDQERARAAVIKRLDEELRGIQLIQEARQIESDLVVQALTNQQNLFQANLSLAQTQSQLEQTRLQGVLSNAEAENNITGAIAARGNILEAQVQAVVQELAGKEASFAISERQQRLDAQRAIQVAEVAAIEAQITLEKAKQSEDSTPEEISGLQQIADLRAAQVDSARDTAAIQDSVLAAQKEELSVQGQLTIEQLRQNKLEESRNKLIDARRGIISALAAESNTSVDDSLASLERVQDRLKEAQRAGLFQGEGGNIREASRDVRRALNSSNSDRAILKLLQEQGNNPEVAALVDAIGRSDLTGLVEASKNFKEATLEFDKSLEVFGATGESVAALRDESIQAAVDSLGINFDPRTTDASILGIQNDPLAAVGAIDNLNEELSRLRPDSSRAQDIEGRIQALQLQNSDLAIVEIADTVRQIKDFTSIIAGNSGRESIGNLTVMTPDPVADTSKIVGDVAAMTTQEVNV